MLGVCFFARYITDHLRGVYLGPYWLSGKNIFKKLLAFATDLKQEESFKKRQSSV